LLKHITKINNVVVHVAVTYFIFLITICVFAVLLTTIVQRLNHRVKTTMSAWVSSLQFQFMSYLNMPNISTFYRATLC